MSAVGSFNGFRARAVYKGARHLNKEKEALTKKTKRIDDYKAFVRTTGIGRFEQAVSHTLLKKIPYVFRKGCTSVLSVNYVYRFRPRVNTEH